MKSLEIVNETYEYAYDKKNDCYPFFKREVEIIKQDLEILEILENKSVNVGRFKAGYYISSTPHQLMRTYNRDCNYIDDELSIDEVIKLKQWLEVNL